MILLSESLLDFVKERFSLLGLKQFGNSVLHIGEKSSVQVGKRKKLWAWKIKCGLCEKKIQLRPDSNTKGRLNHFNRCKSNLIIVQPQAIVL